ncbi:hypothetical protein HYR54_14890 [Candidatus Acetothermia bacterium]|nr:hypothetical protein [Candidatus Acetothermia bacterium]
MTYVEELRQLAKDAGRSNDVEILALIEAVAITGKKELFERAKQMLIFSAAGQTARRDVWFPYPSAGEIDGDVTFGTVMGNGVPVRVRASELVRGMLVTGAPGTGKTTLTEVMAPQVAKLPNANVFLIDTKRDFLGLIQPITNLVVCDLESLKYNPFEVPDGVNPNHHAQVISAIYRKAMGVIHAGEGTFYQGVYELYDRYGVLQNKGVYPTLLDLLDQEKAKKGNPYGDEARARGREIMRLQTLCLALGETINCSKGMNLAELLSSNILLLVEGLNADVRSWLVGSLLVSMMEYRMANGQRGQGLRNWIVIDEGKSLMPANEEKKITQGTPTFTEFLLGAREWGLAALVTEHMPEALGSGIKAGSFIKLMLTLGRGTDVLDMAYAMGLNRDQIQECYQLDNYQGILKLSGRWVHPVKIQLHPSGMNRSVTLEEAKQHSQERLNHLLREVQARVPMTPNAQEKEEKTLDMDILLKHVCEHPFLSMKERFAKVGMAKSKTFKLIERLENEGYIQPLFIRVGRGRPIALLQLTEKGRQHMEQKGVFPPRFRGGLKHAFWVETAKRFFEAQGFKAEKEAPLNDGNNIVFPDLLLFGNDRRLAVEIEISDHGIKNVNKLLTLVDEIYVITEDSELKQKLMAEARKELMTDDFNRTHFMLAQELILPSV